MNYNPWKAALLENEQFFEYSGKSGLCEAKRAAEEHNSDVLVGGHEGQFEIALGASSRHVAEMKFGDQIYGSVEEQSMGKFTFRRASAGTLETVSGRQIPRRTPLAGR